MHVNKSSSMISSVISKSSFSKGGNSSYVSSEIDDIYAQIDKEQKEQE